jgi:2-amino-4-hydroxy-6-hydroxymethyldihydropteridine diphosphokinase
VQINRSIYILLGSNIEPEVNLPLAASYIDEELRIQRCSSVWQSPPHGMIGPCFLNAVVEISSDLSDDQLKNKILRKIEAKLGRIRTRNKFSSRTIDLDIVAIDNEVIDDETWSLDHIAIPLSELAPGLLEPICTKTLEVVARSMQEGSQMIKRVDIQLLPQNSA